MTESRLNAAELVDHWKASGLLPADKEQPLADAIRSRTESREGLSRSLQVLAGFGAVLTAVFFIGFLALIDLLSLDSTAGCVFWMLIFSGLALFLLHYSRVANNSAARSSFFLQFSFCTMLAAKGIWLFQTTEILPYDSHWGWVISTLLMTAATYRLYPLAADRFLSSLAFLAAVANAILSSRAEFALSAEALLNLFFALMFVTAGTIFTHGRTTRDFNPLGYAVLVMLCMLLPYLTENTTLDFGIHRQDIDLLFIRLMCIAALCGLILWAAGGWHSLRIPPVAIALGGALLLGILGTPGILLAIGLLVLGHARYDSVITRLGILALPCFLWQYYYHLNLDLMTKSAVLALSGGLLLAGRAYLAAAGYDREEIV